MRCLGLTDERVRCAAEVTAPNEYCVDHLALLEIQDRE